MGQSNSSHPPSANAGSHHHHHPHPTHPPSTHTPTTSTTTTTSTSTTTTSTAATSTSLDPSQAQPRPHGRSGSISNAATSPGTSASTNRPLKQKKASLDFPGLNSHAGQLTTSQRVPSTIPSAPIPIPNVYGRPREPPPRIVNDSDADLAGVPSAAPVAQQQQQHHHQQQIPPTLPPIHGGVTTPNSQAPPVPTRDAPANSRTPSTASFTRRRVEREQQHRRKKPYRQHTVRSNLPSGVPTAHDGIVNVVVGSEAEEAERVPVLVTWRAPGKKVLVTGTYEPTPWENKTELDYEAGSKCFKTVIYVAPAAYHLKFIVDDVWRCSDDLPTATDGAGHLVNYIDVRRRGEEIKEWGKDWWGVGTEDEEDLEQGAWASHCPPFLITAAEQEEMDEAIRRGQRPPPGTQRLIPFPLPRPPVLPRHLDKVILNQRVVPSTTSSTSRTDHSPTGSSRSRVAAAGFVSPLTSAAFPGGGGVPGGLGVGMGLLGGPGTTPVVDLDAPRRRERSNSRRGVLGPDGLTSPIGDDNSVLPMPSHSVVNHLATSAIRNGVLAVGTTTRYKAKYISTICYRPTRTSPPPQEQEGEYGAGGEEVRDGDWLPNQVPVAA